MGYQEPSRQRRSSQKKSGPSVEQQILEGLLKGLWFLISWPFKRGKNAAPKKGLVPAVVAKELAEHWPMVSGYASAPHTWSLAISEGDKLLDAALKAAGFAGATMADRLKAAEPRFNPTLYNQIWTAHKLRNQLAHEVGTAASAQEVQTAVNTFQWALRELGVFL